MTRKPLTRYLRALGPGLITGSSDNDPAGISTYAVAGAAAGYAFLWLVLLCIPLMIAVQDMAARIGSMCEKGLGEFIGETYGRRWFTVVLAALIIMNVTTIGADLSGMAAAMHLVTGINFRWFILPAGIVIVLIETFWSYHAFARYVKYLTLVLLAYIIDGFIVKPEWSHILRNTFIPHLTLNRYSLMIAVGILGTTISPYMLFWQASQEIEELRQEENVRAGSTPGTVKSKSLRLFDTSVGMLYSNIIAFFIILSSSATLHKAGITIHTASEAASALRPIAGDSASLLFALGLIGSGLIAIPVLAGATAYPLTEWRGYPEGLDKSVYHARYFYTVIAASVLVGVVIAYLPINPIDALFYSQVLMGLLTPIILFMLVTLTSSKSVMGDRNANTPFFSIFGWISIIITVAADVALIWMIVTT